MRSFFLCAFALLALAATGQRKRQSSEFDPALLFNKKWAASFSPLALLQLDFTLMTGAEYQLNPQLRLVADAGYIFSSVIEESENKKASGFIIRPGLKWFANEKSTFYLQPQVFYKQVNHPQRDWVDKNVVNGVATFQQLQDFTYRRNVYGVNVIAGVMQPISKSSKRVFMDVYIGVGMRWKRGGIVGEPDSRVRGRGAGILFGNNGNETMPSIPVGIRFLYLF